MAQKIVLFGCGIAGYEALELFGEENVSCFCDNNASLAGTEKYGKPVISFQKLKDEYCDALIILCVLNDKVACEIAEQCEENGLEDYIFYKSVKSMFSEREQLLGFIADSDNRRRLRWKAYRKRINELQEQVDYFKRHADIRHMKPAEGKLRDRQLELVKGSAELLEKLSGLKIAPFLYCGNLLGYVRHNGFIPWDDDIDFGMMREEYERLKEYCQQHIYTFFEYCNNEKKVIGEKCIADGMEDYYWYDGGDFITLYKPLDNGARIRVDFFALDYYAMDYSFDDLLSYAGKIHKELISGGTPDKRRECLEKARKENERNTVPMSEHIYFGIDNMEIRHKYHRGWIPREVVFPLKKVWYEGAYFWVPNDSEEFVRYEYEDVWDFPDDVGISRHVAMDYD